MKLKLGIFEKQNYVFFRRGLIDKYSKYTATSVTSAEYVSLILTAYFISKTDMNIIKNNKKFPYLKFGVLLLTHWKVPEILQSEPQNLSIINTLKKNRVAP